MYLGRYLPTGETVCLKLTDLNLTTDTEFLEEVISSVRNTSLVRHNAILPYLNSFVESERLWNVTSPVRAGTLRSLMRQNCAEGLPESVAATILKEVALALEYMHGCGFLHNDVRADNILLDTSGEVRVTGLHQMSQLGAAGGGGRRAAGVFGFLGDPEWMSPETILQGSLHSDRGDVYSLGITALELLYGRTPYDNWPPLKILLYKIKYDGVPPIPIKKQFTKAVLRMIDLCLRRDPLQRCHFELNSVQIQIT
jgi:serine/threonine protein kinase